MWFLNLPWEPVVSQAPPALILVREMLARSRNPRFIFKKYLFVLGPPPACLKGYSWLCIPESLLAVLKRPFEMLGIELGSATMCKAMPYLLYYCFSPRSQYFKTYSLGNLFVVVPQPSFWETLMKRRCHYLLCTHHHLRSVCSHWFIELITQDTI